MKYITATALIAASLAYAADQSSSYTFPTDPSAVLSALYQTPPSITGAALTSFASELVSIQTAWAGSPQYTSAIQDIYNILPGSEFSSFAAAQTTQQYSALTAEPWYTSLPAADRSAVASHEAALDSAYSKYVLTTTGSHNAGEGQARATAVWGAAAVGAVGAMLAL